MPTWTGVTFGYALYLAALAWLLPRFARARAAASVTALLAGALWWSWPALVTLSDLAAPVVWVVVPSLALLGSYRVSGLFFVRASLPLEQRLLAWDAVLLHRSGVLRAYYASRPIVRELFELFYLLVYATVPLGATVLLIGGQQDHALASYWTLVFTAELACYAALPWLQTRPPRAIEPAPAVASGPLQRLNRQLLKHGSIQVNTLPSAHAAGAVAVALGVYIAMPLAGLIFLVVAAGITLATMLGRYHYAIDSILGVAVALATWMLLRP